MKSLNRNFTTLTTGALILLSLSGCLKSRLQIRDEAEDQDSGKPVPGKVEAVAPAQGGGYAVDEIKNEMTRLTGRIEDLERAKQDPAAAAAQANVQKEEMKKLETRMTELEQAQAQMIEALKKVQEGQAVAATAAAESPAAYERAKAKYDSADYDGAIESFTSYLKNAKAPKAEDATYYRGESYFKNKQYKNAITDFARITENFKHSRRTPTALFRIGQSFDALGMKDDAKGFYQELLDKHPKSPEAKKAKAKLK